MKIQDPETEGDVPLPGTLTFVMVMGVAFIIGWLLMFALLKGRW